MEKIARAEMLRYPEQKKEVDTLDKLFDKCHDSHWGVGGVSSSGKARNG
jgi:hypothetical protein